MALAAGACVPPVEETTTPAHFNPETVMGQIQERGELRIGVANDRDPFGITTVVSGNELTRAGLTTELGTYVADAMHVEPRFVEVPNDLLLELIDDKAVDLAFPLTTITESLVRHYSVTDPYWIAHQRVLGFDGRFDLEELAGETICSLVDPETEIAPESINPDLEVTSVTAPEECGPLLDKGNPATASDAVLIGMLRAMQNDTGAPEIGGDDLTTEGYGAIVIGDAPGFIEVVDNVLQRAKDDGTWQELVTKWIPAEFLSGTPEPPDLTVEEAAALYPAGD
jgi:ABC-type amino acid transport substrate-binding protein